MVGSRYVDCELFVAGRDQARLSVAGRDYSGRPVLDAAFERRLLEVDLESVRYGTLLFQALFPDGDDLLAGYRESLTVARHEGKRLRLRLHIAAAAPAELHDLHWELLYDPGRQIALGRSQETAFSRYLGVSFEPGKAVTGRPRLLVVLSCPRDLGDYGLPETGREALRDSLERALSPLAELMTLEVLDHPATVERIRDRLVAGEFHALHLTAHGLLPPDEASARLVLETDDGRASFVDEELFSEVFAGHQSLRLVSLIACHGGASASEDPFSGLGPALVRRGVPAVVAMRRQISVAGAMRFAEHFYRNLARNGRVDAAANEARLQLYLRESDSPEWGTPALFMRLAGGRLWRSTSDAAEIAEPEAAGEEAGAQTATAVVKTLALSELVGRTRLAEELGDERMAEILSRHDRLARDLLRDHEGLEADRAGGFLMLFERPIHAVRWALACHQAMAGLSLDAGVELAVRVAIHLGEVVLIETPPDDVARGARPFEVEGLARPIAARLLSLAAGGQTLLSVAAFDLARRSAVGAAQDEALCWMAHGEYVLKGAPVPIAVYEVGALGTAPLQVPPNTEGGRRAAGDRTILGWRPAVALEVPLRPKWMLEKKLSEGGFGEVWLARHEKIKRQRVFKFCFETERLRALQREITLFRLLKEELGDRDDIARILDWNFEQTPFFIESEYAAEGNLVEWTEEQGGIAAVPMAQRLEIVAQLATALAAAHSVGVLHKDVKPANVLIAGGSEGRLQVRLADFGIGAVTERDRLVASGITALGLTAKTEEESLSYSGTRLYMAPELLEGKRATLQADVYALGVVLYQAVVGDFSRALAPGWRRDIGDELLCEDIALAIDGSPERRLGNALRIAERLRSLEERRQEWQAERQEREHAQRAKEALARSKKRRKLVAATIAVLIAFASVMVFQASRIAAARDLARSEAEVARKVSQFMVDLFKVSNPAVARGETITARELLDQGAKKITGGLGDQPLIKARLMHTIGTVYRQLGLYDSAGSHFERALEIRQEQLGREHPEIAKSLGSVAMVYRLQGRHEQAEPLYQDSLEILEETLGAAHPELASSLNGLGIVCWRQGRYEEAESHFRRALELSEKVTGTVDPEMPKILNNLAIIYSERGRFTDALPLYERALTVLEQTQGREDPETASAAENLGLFYLRMNRLEDAERYCRRALDIRSRILDPEHPEQGKSHNNLAEIYMVQGRFREAGERYQAARKIWTEALGPEHRSVGAASTGLADAYYAQGLYPKAEPLYQHALEVFEKVLEPGNWYFAYPLHGLARIRSEQGRLAEAESFYRRALAIREQSLPPGDPALLEAVRELAALLRSTNRQAEAEELEERIRTAEQG